MLKSLSLFAAILVTFTAHAEDRSADVLVYGGTPAGIAAAVAAADDGKTVILVEPYARVGGLTTSGLSHTDFHAFEGLTGFYLDFTKRIQKYYADKYGPESPQAQGTFRGTHAEPKVNLAVFDAMLAERKGITVLRSTVLKDVTLTGKAIGTATFTTPDGKELVATAKVYIDASYEGDLMAKAKVEYRVGREGKAEYGESLAPETADGQLQAYNFRLVMTRVPENRVEVQKPKGYNREDYVGIVPMLEANRFTKVFGTAGVNAFYKAQDPPLPNGKYDINDVSRTTVRLSLPGENLGWPEGDAKTRKEIFDRHLLWNVGLLYFVQNDPAVPAKYRDEAREWGWCKDEFPETNHLPPQLYVREARRMVGQYVYTQQDTKHADKDARAVLKPDAIAMGEYSHNCHGTSHEGPRFGGKHAGEFYQATPPYQIPYGVLVPKDRENLLVPVACSSSHVGFCALRLEPIWMSLGQAAGHAAALAITDNVPVQKVNVPRLQDRLWSKGSATIYTSDVPPGHADFAAVQWWGTHGGLHGLHPQPAKLRGNRILGQYCETYPAHTVDLSEPLTPELREQWGKIASQLIKPIEITAKTRGDFIRAAYAARSGK